MKVKESISWFNYATTLLQNLDEFRTETGKGKTNNNQGFWRIQKKHSAVKYSVQ